jgi:hypothetical protein
MRPASLNAENLRFGAEEGATAHLTARRAGPGQLSARMLLAFTTSPQRA